METESGAEFISPAHVRHIMRYANACKYLRENMTVLDAACGTGYGTNLLKRYCHVAIGVDSDDEAIAEARKNYDDIQFLKADLLQVHLGAMDAIVSIETLEHVSREDGERLVKNFHKWLTRDGILILSTPYCSVSGPSQITKQHLWEYNLTDLEMMICRCGFEVETIELQRHVGQAGRLGYCMIKASK